MMSDNRRTKQVTQLAGTRKPRWSIRAGVLCCMSAMFVPLHAENLSDPTRPPGSVISGTWAGRGAAHRSSGLRSIIISDTRRAAIIDGKTVELGGMHGNARLVEVNEGSVVLQRSKSRQVLTLFPGVKITRKEVSDVESVKMEAPNSESQVEQPSSAGTDESGKDQSIPAAQSEKNMSVQPKEEK
jgi:hypothetical protein